MATVNGDPISLDAVPMYYNMISEVQLNQEVYVASLVVLLYDHCQHWIKRILTIMAFSPLSDPLYIQLSNLGNYSSLVSVTGILQMRLYALFHCSKKLLAFMIVAFVAEVSPIV
ncbi:hypothetical protein J3A83DRAFT_4190110 [Scleroderma citrinum]